MRQQNIDELIDKAAHEIAEKYPFATQGGSYDMRAQVKGIFGILLKLERDITKANGTKQKDAVSASVERLVKAKVLRGEKP